VATERVEINGNRRNWPKLQVGNRVAVRPFCPARESNTEVASLTFTPVDSQRWMVRLHPLGNSRCDDSAIGQYDREKELVDRSFDCVRKSH
jgi:hypothetical protein